MKSMITVIRLCVDRYLVLSQSFKAPIVWPKEILAFTCIPLKACDLVQNGQILQVLFNVEVLRDGLDQL